MAELSPVVIDLSERCEEPGESYSVSGRIEERSYEVGGKGFSLPEGIAYDVVFTNAGDGILVTGMVRAHAEGACDRCLEPASFELAGEIEEYYLFDTPENEGAYEDGFELLGPERTIDLADPVLDAVVCDTPFVVLCREDCRGLCPTCGANLNEGDCGCAEATEDAWAKSDENPFAALNALKLD